ncbi:transmembrane protein, putative [Medicago truncatula]|uniref:Transmembrane protein, putative n=1 Tax=Medicago truncatula TaxID=3880 RepID=G7L670_MEDTR|nr:transmembrane protein, putative [Medicago truncatula]
MAVTFAYIRRKLAQTENFKTKRARSGSDKLRYGHSSFFLWISILLSVVCQFVENETASVHV